MRIDQLDSQISGIDSQQGSSCSLRSIKSTKSKGGTGKSKEDERQRSDFRKVSFNNMAEMQQRKVSSKVTKAGGASGTNLDLPG